MEGVQRYDRLGHRPVAAGVADFGEVAADELAGVLGVPKIPYRNHNRVIDHTRDDRPADSLELQEEVGEVGDEVFPG